jgi:integrase
MDVRLAAEELTMVQDLVDSRRTEPAFVLADRAMLEAWLEFHRATLLLKCEGLDDAKRKARPVPTSRLSLHAAPGTPPIWYDPAIEDSELIPLDDADWEADLAMWHAECERSRANAAGKDLAYTGMRRGEPVSLRWIYVHMIEEYARHNGHADLIRELIDGAVGW